MMILKVEQYLKLRITDYHSYLNQKAFYSAYAELGEVADIVKRYQLNKSLVDNYRKVISDQLENSTTNNIVISARQKEYDHLKHILSIGKVFLPEEIFLIFTIRVQVYLINKLLLMKGIDICALERVDEEIREMGAYKKNFNNYTSAIKKLNKTWPFIFDAHSTSFEVRP